MTDWKNWPEESIDNKLTEEQAELVDPLLEELDQLRATLAERTKLWLAMRCTQTQFSRYMRYMDGMSLKDIAEEDGVTVRAVHKSVTGYTATSTDRSSQPSPANKIKRELDIDPIIRQALARVKEIQALINDIVN